MVKKYHRRQLKMYGNPLFPNLITLTKARYCSDTRVCFLQCMYGTQLLTAMCLFISGYVYGRFLFEIFFFKSNG